MVGGARLSVLIQLADIAPITSQPLVVLRFTRRTRGVDHY